MVHPSVPPEAPDAPSKRRRVGRFKWAVAILALLTLAAAVTYTFVGRDRADEAAVMPPPLDVVWRGGFETGNFAQYVDAPWNFVGGGPPNVVRDPVRAGEFAATFALDGGDRRQEIVPGNADGDVISFDEGDDRWFRFSTRFGRDWPTVDTWQVFTQWKGEGAAPPPIGMLAGSWGADRIQLAAAGWPGGGSSEVHDLGPLVREEWMDWVVHIRFASDPENARVEVWRDGVRVLSVGEWRPSFNGETAGSEGGTLQAGTSSYLKIGIYRDPQIAQRGSITMDGWNIARER